MNGLAWYLTNEVSQHAPQLMHDKKDQINSLLYNSTIAIHGILKMNGLTQGSRDEFRARRTRVGSTYAINIRSVIEGVVCRDRGDAGSEGESRYTARQAAAALLILALPQRTQRRTFLATRDWRLKGETGPRGTYRDRSGRFCKP